MAYPDLPDSCWELIFAHIPYADRLWTLPLVCKRWNSVLDKPSALWKVLRLSDFNPPSHFHAGVLKWLSKRGSAVRQLIVDEPVGDSFVSHVLPYIAHNLRSCTLNTSINTNLTHLLATLPLLPKLEHLRVVMEIDEYTVLQQRSGFHMLGLLTNLKEVTLLPVYDGKEVDTLESAFPTPLLELKNLKVLQVQCSKVPKNLSCLTGLQRCVLWGITEPNFPTTVTSLVNLTYLEMTWNPNLDWPDLLHLPRDISKLTKLEGLALCHGNGLLNAGQGFNNISCLTSLKYLELHNFHLSEIPSFVSDLTNLNSLILNGNDIARVPDWLPSCTTLELLMLDEQNCNGQPLILPQGFTDLVNLQSLVYRGYPDSQNPTEFALHLFGHVVFVAVAWEGFCGNTMADNEVSVTFKRGAHMLTVQQHVNSLLGFLMPIVKRVKVSPVVFW